MKRFLRHSLSTLTYYALRLRNGHHKGVRILTYHRVTDAHPKERLCVPVANFARQMRYLRLLGFQTVTLAQVHRAFHGQGHLPPRPIVVSFDDGFEDNWLHAHPILARHGFRGVFFIPSDFIEASGAHQHHPDDRPMSWEHLETLLAEGHEIGAHSISHHKLTQLDTVEAYWEVRGSKEILEERLKRPVDFFCYPSGAYNQLIQRAVKASGYLGACTVEPGANYPGANLFSLKRTEVSAFDTLWDFHKKLFGAYDWLHVAVQRMKQ